MFVIDYQDRRPLYEQVTEKLKLLILKGALEPGQQLPSVRSLSTELRINPSTIQKAYGALEREGLVYPVKGRGNFVTPDLDAARREKEQILKDLGQRLIKAREAGLSREELLTLVGEVYASPEGEKEGIENEAGKEEMGKDEMEKDEKKRKEQT